MKYSTNFLHEVPRDFAPRDDGPRIREHRCHISTAALSVLTLCGWFAIWFLAST